VRWRKTRDGVYLRWNWQLEKWQAIPQQQLTQLLLKSWGVLVHD
jgi:hypothetical protein